LQLFDDHDADRSATIDTDELFMAFCALEVKHRLRQAPSPSNCQANMPTDVLLDQSALADRGRMRETMFEVLREQGLLGSTNMDNSSCRQAATTLNFVQFCRAVNRFEEQRVAHGGLASKLSAPKLAAHDGAKPMAALLSKNTGLMSPAAHTGRVKLPVMNLPVSNLKTKMSLGPLPLIEVEPVPQDGDYLVLTRKLKKVGVYQAS
jgi:hypothetical protein